MGNKLTIKEILATSFRLFQKSFFQVWHIVTISILLISFLTNMIYMYKVNGVETNIAKFVLSMVLFLINIYFTSLVLLITNNVKFNQQESWKNLLVLINKKLVKLSVSMFIVIISYMLGLIVLVLPGIFLFVLFAMVQPLILFDDHGIFTSIKGSSKLVWKNWWYTFVVIFPLLVISYCLGFSLNYALTNQMWYTFGIDLIIGVIVYPFFYACIVTLFNELKKRKNIEKVTVTINK